MQQQKKIEQQKQGVEIEINLINQENKKAIDYSIELEQKINKLDEDKQKYVEKLLELKQIPYFKLKYISEDLKQPLQWNREQQKQIMEIQKKYQQYFEIE